MNLDLRPRVASAIVLGAVVLLATWYGGAAFRAVAAAVSLFIFGEWTTMSGVTLERRAALVGGWAVVVVSALVLVAGFPGTALVMAAAGAVAAFFWWWAARGKAPGCHWIGGGIAYAVMPASALALLRGDDNAGLAAVFFIYAVVWASDIAAYFAGRFFGGPRLAPAISPSKTWSGAAGGTAAGLVAGVAAAALASGVAAIGWAALAALVISIASQTGDLFESWVKRHFGVKDSGRLIPGHGGVMDRVDGLVFAAFAAYLIALAQPSPATGSASSGLSRNSFGAGVSMIEPAVVKRRAAAKLSAARRAPDHATGFLPWI